MDQNANTHPVRADSRQAQVAGDATSAGGSAHDGHQRAVDPQQAALSEQPRERRQRTKWSPDEVTALLKGVEKHGVSKWAEILADPVLHFAASRKPVDLKDKWRVMTTRRRQLPNLPTAADVASWTPLMTSTHRPDLSASPIPVAGSIPILTTTALPPSVTFQPQPRKRPREASSPPRLPVARAVNRGSTPPLGSHFSLFKNLTNPAMWDPALPSVASSAHSHPPPPAPPHVPHELHPLVLDLLPPDLMLASMWDPTDTAPDSNPPDVQMEDTDTLASFFAQCTMPSPSSNTSLAFLPPSPTATPVTTPTPPPPLLVYPTAGRGRPLTRLSPAPSANLQEPDPTRDFFNSRYHPHVDHRVPPPPKHMLDWANVMRVRSVSPESRNRFAGVARNHADARASPEPAASTSGASSSLTSAAAAAAAASQQQQQPPSFDMSEMLQAVMCLDAPTRSQVFQLLSTREFANSPHKQAVAAKYALRPQDMVPVASPRDEAESAMSVDGEEGLVTQDMRRVLESGKREVLRVTRRGDRDGSAGGGGHVG